MFLYIGSERTHLKTTQPDPDGGAVQRTEARDFWTVDVAVTEYGQSSENLVSWSLESWRMTLNSRQYLLRATFYSHSYSFIGRFVVASNFVGTLY